MKKNYTHIAVVLDRSGSMSSCKADTIGGFNQFLSDQKKVEGEATVTMIQFDNQYEILADMQPINSVNDLTDEVYVPRGGTALLDAIGRTINRVESQINEKPESEQPERVVFVIITDGGENESCEFNNQQITDMINRHRADMHWEFVFIGANQDAFAVGTGYGMRASATMNYDASSIGTRAMYATVSKSMACYRSKSLELAEKDDFFTEADKKDYEDAINERKNFLANPNGILQNIYITNTTENKEQK